MPHYIIISPIIMERTNISSGAKWEDIVGYSRAVRIGNIIEVSGTTAVEDGKVVGVDNAYEQTRFILQKINNSLIKAGGNLENVIRTRMYVTDITLWEEIARAHQEIFGKIKPAATMVEVSRLIDDELLVEIEATAVL